MADTDRFRILAVVLVAWCVGCAGGADAPPPDSDEGRGLSSAAMSADTAPETVTNPSLAVPVPTGTGYLLPPISLPGEACVPLPGAGDAELAPATVPEGTPQQLVAHIVALERQLATADLSEQPALLYQLGAIKSGMVIFFGSPIAAFARMRDDFGLDEITADFIYSGVDFRSLIERFPDHELADDAAYTLSQRPSFGECEGWIACYIERDWSRAAPYLRVFPDSDFAPRVVRRVLTAFGRLPEQTDLRVQAEYRSPSSFRRLAESLDSVAGEMPLETGGPLTERAAEIWTQFAEYERARTALVSILRRRPASEVARCIVDRSAALPVDWIRLGVVEISDSLGAELSWSWDGPAPDSVLVQRSLVASEPGEVVGRPDPNATTWLDAAVPEAEVWWYRVMAYPEGGAVASNPAAAESSR